MFFSFLSLLAAMNVAAASDKKKKKVSLFLNRTTNRDRNSQVVWTLQERECKGE